MCRSLLRWTRACVEQRWRPAAGVGSPGAGVTGGNELSDQSFRTKLTQVLCKEQYMLLAVAPSLQSLHNKSNVQLSLTYTRHFWGMYWRMAWDHIFPRHPNKQASSLSPIYNDDQDTERLSRLSPRADEGRPGLEQFSPWTLSLKCYARPPVSAAGIFHVGQNGFTSTQLGSPQWQCPPRIPQFYAGMQHGGREGSNTCC